MVWIHTGVEVDVRDAIDCMTEGQIVQLVRDLLDVGNVPDGWMHRSNLNLSDGETLLDVIVELRRMGYTVEPGGK